MNFLFANLLVAWLYNVRPRGSSQDILEGKQSLFLILLNANVDVYSGARSLY